MNSILTINAGSSSLKCALYHNEQTQLQLLFRLEVKEIHTEPQLSVKDHRQQLRDQQSLTPSCEQDDHTYALQQVLNWLRQHCPDDLITCISHRIVHGGRVFTQAVQLTPKHLQQLRELIPLAPLHQPFNLKLIDACQEMLPQVPQIACFDTMFHQTQPEVATRFALPEHWYQAGVQRYGFHGLSYEYIAQTLTELTITETNAVPEKSAVTEAPSAGQDDRVIVAHLGAGASLCALRGGKSQATTMGFTALDGLPMATRCGNLDPGVILYLQQQAGLSVAEVEKLLYKDSGWLGVSGISANMSELLESDSPQADIAIELFCYRTALEIASLATTIQGLDQLVFTAGVGEHCPRIRARIAEHCQWLGVSIDASANLAPPAGGLISATDAKIQVRVIATNEELMLARHALAPMGTTKEGERTASEDQNEG